MLKLIYTLLLVLVIPTTTLAQKNLNIGKVLDGRYKKHPMVTDVEITGRRLQDYDLTYYHSLTVKDDLELMSEIKSSFMADEAKAVDKELTNIGGQLYTGLFRLEYDGEVNRFIFFMDMRRSTTKKQNAVILIYMEGKTSLKSLQAKFNKRK